MFINRWNNENMVQIHSALMEMKILGYGYIWKALYVMRKPGFRNITVSHGDLTFDFYYICVCMYTFMCITCMQELVEARRGHQNSSSEIRLIGDSDMLQAC